MAINWRISRDYRNSPGSSQLPIGHRPLVNVSPLSSAKKPILGSQRRRPWFHGFLDKGTSDEKILHPGERETEGGGGKKGEKKEREKKRSHLGLKRKTSKGTSGRPIFRSAVNHSATIEPGRGVGNRVRRKVGKRGRDGKKEGRTGESAQHGTRGKGVGSR